MNPLGNLYNTPRVVWLFLKRFRCVFMGHCLTLVPWAILNEPANLRSRARCTHCAALFEERKLNEWHEIPRNTPIR